MASTLPVPKRKRMHVLPRDPDPDNLTPRTRDVFEQLQSLSDGGWLNATTDDLAAAVGLSRQALHRHLERLRQAKLLHDLEAIGGENGRWRRLRWVGCLQTPFTNPPSIRQTDMHAFPSEDLRSSYGNAGRQAAEQILMTTNIDAELDSALNNDAVPRAFDPKLLPPYPSAHRFPLVAVPRMPRFSGDKHGDAQLLIKAFKCAVHGKYGRRPRVDRKAVFRMQAPVAVMRKLRVKSPFAWAAFRLQQWQFSERKGKPPKVDYVFSHKVIEAHVDQYKRVAASYDVLNKVELAPSHAELLRLWEDCRRACASPKHEPGGEVTQRLVTNLLPMTKYRSLARRIAQERDGREADLYRRLANGEWIW